LQNSDELAEQEKYALHVLSQWLKQHTSEIVENDDVLLELEHQGGEGAQEYALAFASAYRPNVTVSLCSLPTNNGVIDASLFLVAAVWDIHVMHV
jgi:hypothetical protein